MEIILLKDLEGKGSAGDVINVKPGYARNKLIPDGIALRASKRNLAIAEEKKQIATRKQNRENASHDAILDSLKNIEITIEAQVGEEEKMFGSITNIDIHKALEDKGVQIARSAILLEDPIKALGIYHVPIKVAPELIGDIKIYVIKA
jgi:large subunit ribosomal protein L9